MRGPWRYTAGKKQHGFTKNILKHEIDFFLSICCNEYMNTYGKTQRIHGYLAADAWVIFVLTILGEKELDMKYWGGGGEAMSERENIW